MKCPYCNAATKVTNSRSHNDEYSVWRRRQCKGCGAVWSTDEIITLETSHKVIGSDLHLEPFSRDTLYISIFESLAHNNDRLAASTALTDTIIKQLLSQKSADISTDQIKIICHKVLSNFDEVAASVYQAKHNG